jgi:hypothetical protein
LPPERTWLARLPWPTRSVIAGCAGTASLSLAYSIEHLLRGRRQPLDYDDGVVPGQIVCDILNLEHVTGREQDELGLALRWTYGSAFGIWHGLLRRRVSEPWASLAFGATLMTATLTLFPLLGRTPPPWRWPRGFLVTSASARTPPTWRPSARSTPGCAPEPSRSAARRPGLGRPGPARR